MMVIITMTIGALLVLSVVVLMPVLNAPVILLLRHNLHQKVVLQLMLWQSHQPYHNLHCHLYYLCKML